MIIPPYLKPGDTIGIVATARKLKWEDAEPAIGMLSEAGFKIRTGQNMFGDYNQYSGTDEERTADLQRMIDDPEVKAVLVARGGYGTVRVIDRVDFTEFQKHPKWICGFSDITVLHSHINQNLGIATMHSSMPMRMSRFSIDHSCNETLINALYGRFSVYEFANHPLNRVGAAEAEVVGGNLSIMYSIMGSVSDINTDGKFLFLEDLDEYLYHMDRMMMNLKRNGKLSKLKGLIIGGMTDMHDNPIPYGKGVEQIILEAVEEYDYPVCFNFPAGHNEDNRALVFGKKAAIRITNDGSTFEYLS